MLGYDIHTRSSYKRWIFAAFFLGFIVALGIWAASAVGQEPSVAEAARRAREQRKQAAPAKRVWTNDDLAALPQAGVRGPAAEAGEAAVAEGGAPGAAVAEDKEKERGEAQAELKAKRAALERARSELDLLQRDADLKRQSFFTNPNYAQDAAGRAALDDLQRQIQAKRDEGEQIQSEIAGLEQKVKTFELDLGPPKEEPLTADQERASWEAKLRPLREEMARVESELARLRAPVAIGDAQVGIPSSPGAGGNPTSDAIRRLENRRAELQQQITDLEDQARRAGVPAGWIR